MELFLLALCLLGSGCASPEDAIARESHRLATERARLAAVNRELRDLSQVFLYAGHMRQDDVANLALNAALRIVGEPEEGEKQLAMALTAQDVRRRRERAERLLREQERHRQKITEAQDRLSLSLPKLYAARSSFLLRLFLGAGFLGLLALLFSRKR